MKRKLPLSRYMTNKTRIVWERMLARCTDPEHPMFKHFGGRGIKVCKRWGSFAHFLNDMGPRPGQATLERLDRDEDYKPRNCEWSEEREVDHKEFPRSVRYQKRLKAEAQHPPRDSSASLMKLLKDSVRTLKTRRHR